MQNSKVNGYDVVETVKSSNFGGMACIHSNKVLTKDLDKAVRAGADAFQPKPMTADHFAKFIDDGI